MRMRRVSSDVVFEDSMISLNKIPDVKALANTRYSTITRARRTFQLTFPTCIPLPTCGGSRNGRLTMERYINFDSQSYNSQHQHPK
ncbi:hypothetical protein ABKN59_011802 [Abortiporus biennis]